MLSMSNAEILINVFMTSRLDYCNALLGGCSARCDDFHLRCQPGKLIQTIFIK